MKQTENFGLNKPELSEKYDVTKFNENADIIDDSLKFLQDNLGVKINDEESNPAETYSSQKIEELVASKIDQSQVGNGLKFADGQLQLDIPVATASTTYGGDA